MPDISPLLSLLSIYAFIALGFGLKRKFDEKLDDNTLTLISLYALQPVLAFWGLTRRPLDMELAMVPFLYFLAILAGLGATLLLGRRLFPERKLRSVFTVAPLIGNTGNIGIPLGIVLFGVESAAFTSAVNLVNVIVVYVFGVYFFSRGRFSVKESLLNILRLPVLWASFLALGFNASGWTVPDPVEQALAMGAYASMAHMLLLFGMFLYGARNHRPRWKLAGSIGAVKFLLLPLAGFLLVRHFQLAPMAAGVVILELAVPLALMNAVLASLYDCEPRETTIQILVSSLGFLAIFPFLVLLF